MRYFLDTEFNGFNGELLSLALVREDGASVHYVIDRPEDAPTEPWVAEHVLPIMGDCPITTLIVAPEQLPVLLANFLGGDSKPLIIADWPDDISYFCKALITGPGTMADVPGVAFEVVRVDAYPNDGSPQLPGAVQHNAWWDAMALRYVLTQGNRRLATVA